MICGYWMKVYDLENILLIELQAQMAQSSFLGQFSEPDPWQLVHVTWSLPVEEGIRWLGSVSTGWRPAELDTI